MKRLVYILLLLLLTTPCLRAQRKELAQARSYLKSGNNLDKAEKTVADLLARDSVCRTKAKVHMLLYQIVKKQYDIGNEKLYLKEKYDTAALFDLTKRMFTVLERFDSIDAMPDRHGSSSPEYRRRNAAELAGYRPNLYNGGAYHVRKGKYDAAFSFYDMYIDCGRQPLFEGYDYTASDPRMTEAAYWAAYCGYRLDSAEMIMKHYDMALRDTSRMRQLLRFKAAACRKRGDTQGYVAALREGFGRFPRYQYFFPRLMDHYTGHNMLDSALVVADRALAVDGRNKLFLMAKSTVLLNMGRNEDCVETSDMLIGINDSLPEPYFCAATAYLNMALAVENGGGPSKKVKDRIRELYTKACPYMEKYRELAPGEKDKWAPALYRIYLNLNMGRKFEEMDRLLQEKNIP